MGGGSIWGPSRFAAREAKRAVAALDARAYDARMSADARATDGRAASVSAAIFRDPPGLDERAAELDREIARLLVRAPGLPIDLPAFDLTLLGVETDGKGVDLVVGKQAPIARIRIRSARKASGELVALGSRRSAVEVHCEQLHDDANVPRTRLETMARRVAVAVTAERWSAVQPLARQRHRLPVGLPLDHFRQLVPGLSRPVGLVRTGFTCNQDCAFCWQGRDWARHDAAQILTWIDDLYAAGARHLIVSGGEPTLDADLARYIERGRELGFEGINLETNAIQLAKGNSVERLRRAGLTDATVSLHAGNAAASDEATRAPGTFERTVEGVKNLLEADVTVFLNCVITQKSIDHLPALPDFIHRAFGAYPRLSSLMLSLPADPFDRTLLPELIPDPVRLREVLPRTIDRACELGIPLRGLDGPCGPQLCAFGADRRVTSLDPVPAGDLRFRRRLPACERCSVRHACFGPRVVQFERYGDACVAPIEGDVAEPALVGSR